MLVLGVGGTLGEAWLSGFLAGAGERSGADFRQARHFVGTSAGSIVAARLAAGRPPRRPGDPAGLAQQAPPAAAGPARTAAGRLARVWMDGSLPLVGAALRAARPGRAAARAALLARLPQGRVPLDDLRARIGAFGSGFDGRLRVAAVDARTGHRVVFGAPGAPDAGVADAVAASCAVPGLFQPVRIGGRDYVDGGVWSPTNLDIAPVRPGTRVLCLVPTAALTARTGIARLVGRSWQVATAVEAAGARRRGARVTIIGPDAAAAAAMGADLMDASRRDRVADAGFAQGMAAAQARPGAVGSP